MVSPMGSKVSGSLSLIAMRRFLFGLGIARERFPKFNSSCAHLCLAAGRARIGVPFLRLRPALVAASDGHRGSEGKLKCPTKVLTGPSR